MAWTAASDPFRVLLVASDDGAARVALQLAEHGFEVVQGEPDARIDVVLALDDAPEVVGLDVPVVRLCAPRQMEHVVPELRECALTSRLASACAERDAIRVAADEALVQFLSTLAHDLRGPLTPLMLALDLLRRGAGLEPDLERARDIAARQGQALAQLIDELLDTCRAVRGRIALHREPTRLDLVVSQAIAVTRPLADAHHHAIGLRVDAEPVWLDADPRRLQQIVVHLVSRALRNTPTGQIIGVVAGRDAESAVIEVRDSGPAIPEHLLPRLFEPLARLDGAPPAGGTFGLGLTLVHRLVELHGGAVDVASDVSGSTFTVRLPLGASRS